MEERRPTPEEMLARAAEEERERRRGRLKIFFGAAPGVGKTFAMLEAAQAQRRDGLDVVIGWVETHGRQDTDALTQGLERLPPRVIEHRGIQLREFDLDAALARRPGMLLVDELPHTNAPGARHERRWQDVEELLDAGIDVATTLNVQHVESLNDVVAQITGVQVRETVPDSLLDRATEIELVDLPPDDLLRRLREGKVYLPAQAEQALRSFFVKGNLFALRELALRRTAERVDAQVTEWRKAHGIATAWPTRERILVAVGPAPQSANLVRAAYRMADRMRAPWIALSVETPGFSFLPAAAREMVSDHLQLAQELGGEALVVRGDRIADEVLAVCEQRNVTRILVGKPTHSRWLDKLRGSLLEDLIRRSGGIDVHVTTGEVGPAPHPGAVPTRFAAPWTEYVWAIGTVLFITGFCWSTRGVFDLVDEAMIYLLGVLLLATRLSRIPSLLSAFASVAALDFFFVPPLFTFAVSDFRYFATFGVMLVVGLLVSSLTVRIREQAEAARLRERRTSAIYAMSRELVVLTEIAEIAAVTVKHVEELLEAPAVVLLSRPGGELTPLVGEAIPLVEAERERAVARWVLEHGRPAGHGTATLPGSELSYLPLVGARKALGVFAVALGTRDISLTPSQTQLLETIVAQTALALERALVSEEAERARMTAETERTRSSLLSAVSHDLRTPLASITGAAGTLLDEEAPVDATSRRDLLESIRDEATRLSRLVSDLLELTRLESGHLQVNKEWCPIEEVIGSALGHLEGALAGKEVRVDVPRDVLLVAIDPVLIEQVLINLVDNAVKYGSPPIEIAARVHDDGRVLIEVADHGPGIPAKEMERIFEKFYRAGDGGRAPGAGLGLTVCQAIIRAHSGKIWAYNREHDRGAVFAFELPAGTPPTVSPGLEEEREAEAARVAESA